MKKSLLAAAVLAALMAPQVVGAEGFGIVEWSSEGVAMGGARMFADNDPATIAFNPAHLVSIEKKAAGFHVTQISPHGKFTTKKGGVTLEQDKSNRIAPGMVPGMYYAQKIDDKSAWGLGTFTRFGMVSEFEPTSIVSLSAYKSKMTGLSITPVYARKLNKKLSGSVGAELNYVDLTLYNNPGAATGTVNPLKIAGDTWAAGWNASLDYKFDDKNEVGFVYRSKISQNMTNAKLTFMNITAGIHKTKVVLPDTYTIGYGHKFNEKTRMEVQAMRTNWHTYESLWIHHDHPVLDAMGRNPVGGPKEWSDGWRLAIGLEHKFSDKYTGYLGYSYDEAGIPALYADYMIPTGDRRTYSIGCSYKDKKQMVTGTLGYMDIGDKHMGTLDGYGLNSNSRKNYAKIWSLGYTRFF